MVAYGLRRSLVPPVSFQATSSINFSRRAIAFEGELFPQNTRFIVLKNAPGLCDQLTSKLCQRRSSFLALSLLSSTMLQPLISQRLWRVKYTYMRLWPISQPFNLDVHAIIHVASPLPARDSGEVTTRVMISKSIAFRMLTRFTDGRWRYSKCPPSGREGKYLKSGRHVDLRKCPGW